jgi:glycerol uptake facilitator-like aquaporin
MRFERAGASRRLAAEFLGCALLNAVVIGSGIAAQRLSPGDVGLQLLENVFAICLALPVLILVFGPLSGAHFNPLVSLIESVSGGRSWGDTAMYIPAQVVGSIAGAILANLMFGVPAINISTTERLSGSHVLGEVVATAGLILVIFALARTDRGAVAPAAIAAYIAAACFFTSSCSFVNPAITIGRAFSDSFAGIAPGSVPGYIAAQLCGAAVGMVLVWWLFPTTSETRRAAQIRSSSTSSG